MVSGGFGGSGGFSDQTRPQAIDIEQYPTTMTKYPTKICSWWTQCLDQKCSTADKLPFLFDTPLMF